MKSVLALMRNITLTYQGQHCHEGCTGFNEEYNDDFIGLATFVVKNPPLLTTTDTQQNSYSLSHLLDTMTTWCHYSDNVVTVFNCQQPGNPNYYVNVVLAEQTLIIMN